MSESSRSSRRSSTSRSTFLDRLRGVPGYALRVGDFRVIVDWDREADVLYVVEVLERKHDYRELSSLREVWGTWRE